MPLESTDTGLESTRNGVGHRPLTRVQIAQPRRFDHFRGQRGNVAVLDSSDLTDSSHFATLRAVGRAWPRLRLMALATFQRLWWPDAFFNRLEGCHGVFTAQNRHSFGFAGVFAGCLDASKPGRSVHLARFSERLNRAPRSSAPTCHHHRIPRETPTGHTTRRRLHRAVSCT